MPYKLRRNSVSDVKKPNEPLVRRRNSVERESGVISSVVRARQNLPYNQTRKQNPTVENKLLLENKGKEHRHMPVTKAGNLVSKNYNL